MSTAEYKRLMSQGNQDGAMSDEEFKKTLKNQQVDYANQINKKSTKGVGTTFNGQFKGVGFAYKPRNHEEDDVTIQVTDYLEVLKMQGKVVLFSHVPQETFTKSWATKNKNKAMGVRAGVPDMIIVYPDRVLFLELKRLKGGVVSVAQNEWIDALQQVGRKTDSRVYAGIAYGFDDAKNEIDSLLD